MKIQEMALLLNRIPGQMAKSWTSMYTSRVFNFSVERYNSGSATPTTTPMLERTERMFTKSHEWVKVIRNVATVGLTEHAVTSLGDIVYIQLPNHGAAVKQDEVVGVVESVKSASDIFSPVSGDIVNTNESVKTHPSLLNSCYRDGWLFKIQMKDTNEIKSLMNKESYEEYLKSGSA